MAMSSSAANRLIKSIRVGDQVEFDYLGKEIKGKVKEITSSISPVVKVSGQYGLTDTITEFALSSSGYITYLKINGKKCKRIGINDGKKWSEPVKNAHYIGMADCFQYYNPTIKEYISSRIKQ